MKSNWNAFFFLLFTVTSGYVVASEKPAWQGFYGSLLFGESFGMIGESNGSWLYSNGPDSVNGEYLSKGTGAAINGFSTNLKLGFNQALYKNIFGVELSGTLQNAKSNGIAANYEILNTIATDRLVSNTKVKTYETIGFRYGRLIRENTMVYGLGGIAGGQIQRQITQLNDGVAQNWLGYGVSSNAKQTKTGYILGVGLEHKLQQHWAFRINYEFVNFGKATFNYNSMWLNTARTQTATAAGTQSNHIQFSNVSAGISYQL